jgi:hypothetical protein
MMDYDGNERIRKMMLKERNYLKNIAWRTGKTRGFQCREFNPWFVELK